MTPSTTDQKVMSHRLAGMKFMQRSSGTPSTPTTPAEPPAKRQRLSNGSSIRTLANPATPVTPDDTPDHSKSEPKWYLSYNPPPASTIEKPLRIISVGFSSLDAVAADDDTEAPPRFLGRKSFGNFNKKLENPDLSSDEDEKSDDESEGEDDIEDDPTGIEALIAQGRKEASNRARVERNAKRKTDAADLAQRAAQRRKKEVNLNGTKSISGSGRSSPAAWGVKCHRCSEMGHYAKECPQKREGSLRRSY